MNSSIGIRDANIFVIKDYLICTFRRENTQNNSLYLNLNNESPYVIAAQGPLQGTGY